MSPNCFGDQGEVEHNGKCKGGLKPTDSELKEILKQHAAWVKDDGPFIARLANDPRRANFCEANLDRADLSGADLGNARDEQSETRLRHFGINHAVRVVRAGLHWRPIKSSLPLRPPASR
jgi:hypothetical protein